jgi:membrane protease subunit (stomatin/prohibitin family)
MAKDVDERMRLKRRAENLDVYKVERSFDTTEKAAENIGGGSGGDAGGILGTMVGLGMVNPIAEQMGSMMAKNAADINQDISSSNENEDTIKLLKQLGELKEAGILTEEEFAEKKKELLNKLK